MRRQVIEAGGTRSRYRLLIVGALAFGWLSLSIDRNAIAAVLPFIRAEFGIDHDAAGVLGSLYFLTYTLGHFPAGILTDRIGPKRTIRIGTATLVATVANGLVYSYFPLLAIRTVLGLAQAHYWTPAMSLVGRWAGTSERARAISFLMLAQAIGASLTPPLAAITITLTGSWHPVFWWIPVLGVIALIALQRAVFDNPKDAAAAARLNALELEHLEAGRQPAPVRPRQNVLGQILRDPMLWVFSAAVFCITALFHGVSVWTTSYLYEQQGLDVVGTGIVAMIALAVGALALIAGGWFLDKRGLVKPTFVVSTVLLVPVFYLLAVTPRSVLLATTLLALVWVLLQLPFGGFLSYQIRRYPADVLGRAVGVGMGMGALGGFVGPAMAGFLVTGQGDHVSFQNAFTFYAAVAALGAICGAFLSEKPFELRV